MKQLLVIGVVGAAILMPALAATAEDQGAVAAPPQPIVTNQAPAQVPAVGTRAREAKKEVELQDLTLTGKLTSESSPSKRGGMVTRYILTDVDGAQVVLPAPHTGKRGPADAQVINLADYVGAYVKVTAKGTETAGNRKGVGGKTTYVQSITTIEKIPQP